MKYPYFLEPVPMRRYYCSGSAHRLGIRCRFCEPTRLEAHEATCHGPREWVHVLAGEHVRLAKWDLAEADFMTERAWERVLDRTSSEVDRG